MTTWEFIKLILFIVALPVLLIVIFAIQQRDKDKRQSEGLPPKK